MKVGLTETDYHPPSLPPPQASLCMAAAADVARQANDRCITKPSAASARRSRPAPPLLARVQ